MIFMVQLLRDNGSVVLEVLVNAAARCRQRFEPPVIEGGDVLHGFVLEPDWDRAEKYRTPQSVPQGREECPVDAAID